MTTEEKSDTPDTKPVQFVCGWCRRPGSKTREWRGRREFDLCDLCDDFPELFEWDPK